MQNENQIMQIFANENQIKTFELTTE